MQRQTRESVIPSNRWKRQKRRCRQDGEVKRYFPERRCVTFEQLGVDRLFVDESHYYKNLFLHTKMRNVAGIAQSEAQKSSDMFAKCQYLDELTGGKGITFATGTPISNSMTELYTNMRYLQYDTLQQMGLGHFDAWASSFGETQTAIELAPEGTGYRAKTRFAKFYNLPELISLFKECAVSKHRICWICRYRKQSMKMWYWNQVIIKRIWWLLLQRGQRQF